MDDQNISASFSRQYHENFLRIRKNPTRYSVWMNKRAGLIKANELLPKGYKALEIGCGNGCNFHLLHKAGYILGIEVNRTFIPIIQNDIVPELPKDTKVEVKGLDIREFSIEEKFDFIFSVYVLWDRVIISERKWDELVSHLNDGGFLFIYTRISTKFFQFPCYESEKDLIKAWCCCIRNFIHNVFKFIFNWRLYHDRDYLIKSLLESKSLNMINEVEIKDKNGVTKAMLWQKSSRGILN